MGKRFTRNLDRKEFLKQKGFIPTEIEWQPYSKPSQYVESNCFAITFHNDGNVFARVNNKPLAPGQTITIPSDHPFFDVTKYKLTFNFPAAGATRLVWVGRRILSMS